MKYTEFLEKAAKTINLEVDEFDTICYTSEAGDLKPIKINNLPVVLPTTKNIGSYYDVVDGNKKYFKVLFNPLKEDVINGDSEHLLKLKHLAEQRIHFIVKTLGGCLLLMAKDTELQEDSTLIVEQYLTSIANIQTKGKKQVDDETLKNWSRLCNKLDKATIFLKKKGKINKEEFNRVAVFSYELYGELQSVAEDKTAKKTVNDIDLKNKDIRLYIATIEFILQGLNKQTQTIQFGSRDKYSPAFHALYSLILEILKRTNHIAKALMRVEGFENDILKKTLSKESLSEKDLENLSRYEPDVEEVPGNLSTSSSTRGKLSSSLPNYKKAEHPVAADEEGLSPTEIMVKRRRESMGLPFTPYKDQAQNPNTPENCSVMYNTSSSAAQQYYNGQANPYNTNTYNSLPSYNGAAVAGGNQYGTPVQSANYYYNYQQPPTGQNPYYGQTTMPNLQGETVCYF